MPALKSTRGRRDFLVRGGIMLSTSLASTLAVSAAASPADEELKKLRNQVHRLQDRDAIRRSYRDFMTFMHDRRYAAVAELFDTSGQLRLGGAIANGRRAICLALAAQHDEYNQTRRHNAYRQTLTGNDDQTSLSIERERAEAGFNIEVEVCTPRAVDCTAAHMARLQGDMVDRRWEPGRLRMCCGRQCGEWKITSLQVDT
jgi:hypothetical protein